MVGAQGEEGHARRRIAALNGVKDRDGIIHHTEGIDGNGKTLFQEPTANLIGETGAHKENGFQRLYLEVGFGDTDYCTKIHMALTSTDL